MRLGKVPEGMVVEAARYVLNDEVIGMLYAGGPADQAGLVHRYMTDEGFEASRTGVAGGGYWDSIFDEHEVDILLAGNHPDGADACVEFARRVVQRNPLIDVLVHGVRNVEPITKYDRSLYTALLTHPGTDYAGRAIELIRTHRKKWNDVIFLRGMVITQIVNVEAHINDALAAHFGLEPGTARGGQFEEYVLENPMYMLEGKKRALSKILDDAGLGPHVAGDEPHDVGHAEQTQQDGALRGGSGQPQRHRVDGQDVHVRPAEHEGRAQGRPAGAPEAAGHNRGPAGAGVTARLPAL